MQLKGQRQKWKEEQQQCSQVKSSESSESSEEETQKAEPITLQITETRTKSEKIEVKQEAEKKPSHSGEKKERTCVDRHNVPPGPGKYTLQSDVYHYRTKVVRHEK